MCGDNEVRETVSEPGETRDGPLRETFERLRSEVWAM